MKKLRVGLALVGGALCFVYLGAQLRDHWSDFAALDWGLSTVLALVVASLLQAASFALDAWWWTRLLRELGIPAESRRGISIFGVSQFAKYLPGNVAQHLGRIGLAREAGWQTGRVTLSLFVENGFALGTAAVVAATSVLLPGTRSLWSTERLVATILSVLAAWLLGTLVLKRVLARPPALLRRLLSFDPESKQSGIDLRARFLVWYFTVHLAGYAVMGVCFALLLRAMAGSWPQGAWLLPAAVTVAWLAGFLVPGAPAGLGVREVALTALLGPSLGVSLVLSASALWRLSHVLSDLLMLGLGLALRKDGLPAPPARGERS